MSEIASILNDLRAIDFTEMPQETNGLTCHEIEIYLRGHEGNNGSRLLAQICSYHFEPEKTREPFSARLRTHRGRTAIPDDIDTEHLNALSEYCPEVNIPELKARIADVLWIRRVGGVRFAWIAIEAYFLTCKQLLTASDTWVYAYQRLERAARLNYVFRRAEPYQEWAKKLTELLSTEYERAKREMDDAYPLKLMRLAYDCNLLDRTQIANELLWIAKSYRDKNNFSLAISSAEDAVGLAISQDNKEQQYEIWRLISEINQLEALCQDGGLISAGCIQRAIEALAKIPGTKSERISLYEEMREYQSQSLNQMCLMTTPSQDISELVTKAILDVQGKDIFDMVFRLAMIVSRPTNIAKLKEHALEIQSKSIAWMFSATHIDHDGMSVAKVPGGIDIESEDSEALWAIMMRHMQIDHQLAVRGQIIHALDEINIKHPVTLEFLRELIVHHPFVPSGHEEFFVKGIYYGFQGDYISACHLLIPQVENSLRHIARLKGDEPSVLHGDGVQERSGLKGLLDNPLILEALGQDIVTNVSVLMLDKIYGDLRNQLSHGYISANDFNQPSCIYMWWLILHIIMCPMSKYWIENYKEDIVK